MGGLLAAPLAAQAQTEPSIVVFAPVSIQEALNKAGWVYVAMNGHPVRFTFGASPDLARQIDQGAPADVFISADADWMDYLAKKQLIVERTRRNILTNHLALIAPAKSKISLMIDWKMPLAKTLAGGRLAIAAPEDPAGRYGQAALTKLGVWDEVKSRLAVAANERAALAMVAHGGAPLGIVYDTDAKVEPGVRIVGVFPDASHPPILYSAAVLAKSTNADALGFLTSLNTPLEANVFRKLGFRVLKR